MPRRFVVPYTGQGHWSAVPGCARSLRVSLWANAQTVAPPDSTGARLPRDQEDTGLQVALPGRAARHGRSSVADRGNIAGRSSTWLSRHVISRLATNLRSSESAGAAPDAVLVRHDYQLSSSLIGVWVLKE